jgi:AraC family transcriptional activator FtrA
MSDRSFVAETGTTPHIWLTLQRVLLAQRLLEDTDLGIDAVADRCGFGGAALLRHHLRNVGDIVPTGCRRTFRVAAPVA